MIARVTLEIALRKEFDYLVPEEFQDRVEIGSRVKVPFGPRKVMGVVTGLPAQSEHCLLYTSPSPRDRTRSRMPSSA